MKRKSFDLDGIINKMCDIMEHPLFRIAFCAVAAIVIYGAMSDWDYSTLFVPPVVYSH